MARGNHDPDRRGALKTLVIGGSAAFVAGSTIPAARLALGPAIDSAVEPDKWVRVAKLSDLEDGQPKRAPVVSDSTDAFTRYAHENIGAVWLLRDKEEVRALSVICPHLGCGIEKLPQGFGCPCHTSAFDASGKRVSGPAPRDMDTIDARVVGDGPDRVVEVRYRKYRQGIAEREEV